MARYISNKQKKYSTFHFIGGIFGGYADFMDTFWGEYKSGYEREYEQRVPLVGRAGYIEDKKNMGRDMQKTLKQYEQQQKAGG